MTGLERHLRQTNRGMIAIDLVLGLSALVSPQRTLLALGHDRPNAATAELFRRLGPIWLTFAAAHTAAAIRDRPDDWWALAWLRGTEIATDVLWARSPAFSRPGARIGLKLAGAANAYMALGYAALSRRSGTPAAPA